MIDRVEILRGPASSLYGPDAIGGVIQVFTKKGQAGFKPFVSAGIW
jgi:vitamin B12 transporter